MDPKLVGSRLGIVFAIAVAVDAIIRLFHRIGMNGLIFIITVGRCVIAIAIYVFKIGPDYPV